MWLQVVEFNKILYDNGKTRYNYLVISAKKTDIIMVFNCAVNVYAPLPFFSRKS